ncbi:hypothetical protein [Haloarcula sp. CGMCC 1.2071]
MIKQMLFMIDHGLSTRTQFVLALVGGSMAMILIMRRIKRNNTLNEFGLWTPWMAVGSLLLLAVPIYLFLKYSLVLPLLATVSMTVLVLWRDSTAIVDSPAPLFFGWWFMPLAVALILGTIECFLRGIVT